MPLQAMILYVGAIPHNAYRAECLSSGALMVA